MWRDEETEPLASSLHLSLSAAVEHSRDTDTLLNTNLLQSLGFDMSSATSFQEEKNGEDLQKIDDSGAAPTSCGTGGSSAGTGLVDVSASSGKETYSQIHGNLVDFFFAFQEKNGAKELKTHKNSGMV